MPKAIGLQGAAAFFTLLLLTSPFESALHFKSIN